MIRSVRRVAIMELRLKRGGLEFLMAGFFLGILFALSILLNYFGEPVSFEAILLLLGLATCFVVFFVLGTRATKGRKENLPLVYSTLSHE
jgi:hypothetical protein